MPPSYNIFLLKQVYMGVFTILLAFLCLVLTNVGLSEYCWTCTLALANKATMPVIV